MPCELRECEGCHQLGRCHVLGCGHVDDRYLQHKIVDRHIVQECTCPYLSNIGSQLGTGSQRSSKSPSPGVPPLPIYGAPGSSPRLPPTPIYHPPTPENRAVTPINRTATPVNRSGTPQRGPGPQSSLARPSSAAPRPAAHEPRPLPNQPYRQQATSSSASATQRPAQQAIQFNMYVNARDAQINVLPPGQAVPSSTPTQRFGDVQLAGSTQVLGGASNPALPPMRTNPPPAAAPILGPVYRMHNAPIPQNSPLPDSQILRTGKFDDREDGILLWLYDNLDRASLAESLWSTIGKMMKRTHNSCSSRLYELKRDGDARLNKIRRSPFYLEPPSRGRSAFDQTNNNNKRGGGGGDGSGGAAWGQISAR